MDAQTLPKPPTIDLRLPLPGDDVDPKGELRTELTIAAMDALVRSALNAPGVTKLAYALTSDRPTIALFLERLYDSLRAWVRFEPDPKRVELLRHPEEMAYAIITNGYAAARGKFGAFGDCDDMAMLGAALIQAVGLEPCFITIATDPAPNDRMRHVFFGHWHDTAPVPFTPLDPQEGYPPGHMPKATRIKYWQLSKFQLPIEKPVLRVCRQTSDVLPFYRK